MLAFSTPSWKKQPQVLSNPKVTVATLRSRAACASEIVPRVYVSDYSTATDAKALVKLGVTHVVTCMEDAPGEKNLKVKVSVGGKEQERVIKRLHVPVSDLPSVDLACWFDETTAWITQALEEDEHNVVLVHCLMGMSRSATIVCAYLIATRGLHAPDAISFVRVRRKIVRPNMGFVRQLETFAESIDRTKLSPNLKAPSTSSADTVSTSTSSIASTSATINELPEVPLLAPTSLAAKIRRYMANANASGMKVKKIEAKRVEVKPGPTDTKKVSVTTSKTKVELKPSEISPPTPISKEPDSAAVGS